MNSSPGGSGIPIPNPPQAHQHQTRPSIASTAVAIAILCWLGLCWIYYLTQHAPLAIGVFIALPSAIARLQFRFPAGFFSAIAVSMVSLSLYALVGSLFLRLLIKLPRLLHWTASIFVGIGLATFIFEFLAIAFLLHPLTVWLGFAAMILALGWMNIRIVPTQRKLIIEEEPLDALSTWIFRAAFCVLSCITAMSFYHALFYPVNYWDSLIYYVDYAEKTFKQGGFPIAVCLQVGIGLGANYPHLFPLFQAVTGMLFNHWSDLYGQLLCPLAGVGTCVVIYYLSLHLFRNRLIAILAALTFRSIPYVTSYFIWASDYALIMGYTMLFVLFLYSYTTSPTIRSIQPLLCVAAIFPHINYLGWIVWPVAGLAALFSYKDMLHEKKWGWLIASASLWLALALTWYVRNYIVAGNPVYAFFPEILGGKNINLDVLRSAENEWKTHGFGAAHIPGDSVWIRLLNTPWFFMADWRFAPFVMGIMIPALILGWKKKPLVFWLSAILAGLYGFYAYFISGFYWYHIIAVFPILGLFSARFLHEIHRPPLIAAFGVLITLAGIMPGLSYSIMGPKNSDPRLAILSYPGLDQESFYRIAFPGYAPAWKIINDMAHEGDGVLSHENRLHVFRDDLKIMHLDDCGLVPMYGAPYPDIHRYLWNQGIRFYLYIEDEDSHPITANVGHRFRLNDPAYFQLLDQTQKAAVYKLQPPPDLSQ